MILRVDSLIKGSVLHGPGLRYVIVTQGCHTNCPGCNAQQTFDPKGGRSLDTNEIVKEIYEGDGEMYNGITFTGGEPFLQADALSELAGYIIRANSTKINKETFKQKDIICYTGYTYEEIQQLIKVNYVNQLLNKDAKLKAMVKKAAIYPIIVVCVAIAVVIVIFHPFYCLTAVFQFIYSSIMYELSCNKTYFIKYIV